MDLLGAWRTELETVLETLRTELESAWVRSELSWSSMDPLGAQTRSELNWKHMDPAPPQFHSGWDEASRGISAFEAKLGFDWGHASVRSGQVSIPVADDDGTGKIQIVWENGLKRSHCAKILGDGVASCDLHQGLEAALSADLHRYQALGTGEHRLQSVGRQQ
jgi:hypothetical protein